MATPVSVREAAGIVLLLFVCGFTIFYLVRDVWMDRNDEYGRGLDDGRKFLADGVDSREMIAFCARSPGLYSNGMLKALEEQE